MLENTVDAVEKARAAGATIIHSPISFAPGYGEITSSPYGILAGVVESNAFVKGTWGAVSSTRSSAPSATSSWKASVGLTASPAPTWT